MLKESLGMLEVRGLVAAITVGDTMAKAANVHVRQRTLARGNGWTTILVTGDVGSVNAALSAGKSVAAEHGWLISSKVIARPASMLELALEPDVNERITTESKPKAEEIKTEIKEEIKKETKEETKEEIMEEIPEESIKEETKEDTPAEVKAPAKKSGKTGSSKGRKTNPKKK